MVNKDLSKWKDRLADAKAKYSEALNMMTVYDSYYNGTRTVYKDGKRGIEAKKGASNVWNIVYELVESQVDSTIPLPRVEAVHEEDAPLAKNIEDMLRSYITKQHFDVMNDLQERTVPIQGGSFWQVEWDSKAGTHHTIGDVRVSERHPKTFIPQPGCYDMRDMQYMFLQLSQSRKFLERQYGVDIKDDTEEEPSVRGNDASTVQGLVTQNIAYYRNKKGGIGVYSWVNDVVLLDIEDYQARRTERCAKCGCVKHSSKCECGSTKFKEVDEEYEEITEPITLFTGEVIDPDAEDEELLWDNGLLLDDNGEPIVMPKVTPKKIPYYKPNCFPVILRKNVSKFGSLLGCSDVSAIADQQDDIKQYGTKLKEKILKGGSYVTLPSDVSIETTDEELKVIRLDNAMQKALVSVINVQPDITKEMTSIETSYSHAKSTIGITDAFQGKYDSSAKSGTAKQFSASQSAGRLESKRMMKNSAYSDLYKMIFQFMLAYSDQNIPISYQTPDGQRKYTHFNRYDFLRIDEAGEYYWDDEFIFSIDPSATLSNNRNELWSQMDLKYQNGAYGVLGQEETMLRYWTQLANTNYPYAEQVKASLMESMQKKQEEAYAMSAMQDGMPDSGCENAGEYINANGYAGAGNGMPQQ